MQEKVFTKLLSDETTENQYCCDCGSKLQSGQYDQIYVSINHGIFLCHNCASIHQAHYGVEISFVKSIIDNRNISETSSIYSKEVQTCKLLNLSKWTYTQLRVLIISGVNKAFRDYMEQYDLMSDTIQKRYNSVAAQYYRDHLKNKIKGVFFFKLYKKS